MTNLSYAPSV
jgi:hypothetical protein